MRYDKPRISRESHHRLTILAWHVHGSWMDSFVRGGHTYLLPFTSAADEWGRGRCGRNWPDSAIEVTPCELAHAGVDLVVLQRPHELELAQRWLGRTPGVDVPAIYVEHNTPRPDAVHTRHPLAGRSDIPLVHVTHFNNLMWDNGICPTTVITHGIADPGYRYTGALPRAATMINEPVRRGRVTGTDLLPVLARTVPIDVFGIGTQNLTATLGSPDLRGGGDLSQAELHREVARRRVFLHTPRWTSLGLSLIEAMFLGMPIVALASTEAPAAVPPAAGVVSADLAVLAAALRRFTDDPDAAYRAGRAAREAALANFSLSAFLQHWDQVIGEVAAARPLSVAGRRE